MKIQKIKKVNNNNMFEVTYIIHVPENLDADQVLEYSKDGIDFNIYSGRGRAIVGAVEAVYKLSQLVGIEDDLRLQSVRQKSTDLCNYRFLVNAIDSLLITRDELEIEDEWLNEDDRNFVKTGTGIPDITLD